VFSLNFQQSRETLGKALSKRQNQPARDRQSDQTDRNDKLAEMIASGITMPTKKDFDRAVLSIRKGDLKLVANSSQMLLNNFMHQ